MAVLTILALLVPPLWPVRSSQRELETAQSAVAAVIQSARVHASLSGQRTRVMIDARVPSGVDDSLDYLRKLEVVVENDARTAWRTTGTEAWLPGSVRMVDDATLDPAGRAVGETTLASTLSGPVAVPVSDGSSSRSRRVYFLEFTPLGSTLAATIVLAPADYVASARALQLTAPDSVAGLRVSAYGAVTWLPDRRAF